MRALTIAVHDAATNCERDGGRATVTLKGGVQYTGIVEKPTGSLYTEGATVHMRIEPGGWVTLLFSEVAAVSVVKVPAF